ncbi:MAG: glycoside hydrolase family 25 protein [Acetatifactor sp.]|nr:glycoside hydrolase family 25 protein [Acetatifactor sp.]
MNNDWKSEGTNGKGNAEETSYLKRREEDRLSRKKKGAGQTVLTTLVCSVVLVLVTTLGIALYAWIDEAINKSTAEMAVNQNVETQVGDLQAGDIQTDGTYRYTQEELDAQLQAASLKAEEAQALAVQAKEDEILGGIRTRLEEGGTMVETLRPYYPNELVLVSNGTFHFVPIREDLEHNNYVQENLQILESGEYQYLENEQVISHKGIDVSHHQGAINWQKVAEDGVEFALIRTVYRGYKSGALAEDSYYKQNIEGASAAGIHVGVYVFTQAITLEEIEEEAALVLEQLAPYQIDGPIVIDVEKTAEATGRMNQISVEERTNLVLQFCRIIENAGYKPMIYHNMEMGALLIDIETFEGYGKWFASYSDQMYYPYAYDIWQYSSTGRVNGIKGDVDLNISFTEFWNE